MVHICVCKYPLIILDNRDGNNIEHIAMPTELIDGGYIPSPTIVPVTIEGVDYMAVEWQEHKDNDHIKEYEVVGHKVLAGCEPSEIKIANGAVTCDTKKIYVVLHPKDEWTTKHIVELKR